MRIAFHWFIIAFIWNEINLFNHGPGSQKIEILRTAVFFVSQIVAIDFSIANEVRVFALKIFFPIFQSS